MQSTNILAPAANEAGSDILSDYLSRQQLAAELKVTTRTLQNWAWLRKGPPITKIGRRPYYKRSAVRAWLDAGGIEEAA